MVRTTQTEADGRYAVPALPPGKYTVAASQSGFSSGVRDNVTLFLGESLSLDFVLQVASVSQTVAVTGEVPAVRASRTELSTLINQQQIDSLPINGRNFISFSVITPGVSTDRTPQQGSTLTSGLSFAGQRAPIEQHHGRRPRQQRSGRRRGAGDVQPGGDPRVPGAGELLLRRVRQGVRRGGQHRDQERHQRPARQRLSLFPRQESQRQESFRALSTFSGMP